MSASDMQKMLADARKKLQVDAVLEDASEQIFEAHRQRIRAVNAAREGHDAETKSLRETHAVEATALRSKVQVLETVVAAHPQLRSHPQSHRLRTLISEFLEDYPKKKRPMLKKHRAALGALESMYGDKLISELRQRELAEFFKLIQALPPRWAEKCKKLGISMREFATQKHPVRLSKKTFTDNYVVPITLFLGYAQANWAEDGFPLTLNTKAIEFKGEDDDGKNRQRAFNTQELGRLFQSVLAPFRKDSSEEHKWWLPVLAYYTGARINELCQLNPHTDVGVSNDSIDFVLITQDTEGDARIAKSVKTRIQRHVPLHPALIASGFLDYVQRVRQSGAKLLFPAWAPTNKRASTQAERWFRDLLRDNGLRDETPGARVVGFHAFRHTLLTYAVNSTPPVDAGPITGHSDPNKSGVQRKYEGERWLPNKLKILTEIQFGLLP